MAVTNTCNINRLDSNRPNRHFGFLKTGGYSGEFAISNRHFGFFKQGGYYYQLYQGLGVTASLPKKTQMAVTLTYCIYSSLVTATSLYIIYIFYDGYYPSINIINIFIGGDSGNKKRGGRGNPKKNISAQAMKFFCRFGNSNQNPNPDKWHIVRI